MKRLLESKYGLLIFSLLSGMGYFILIMMLMRNIKYSYLLGIFFFPAVICGSALCIYKTLRTMQENNDYKKIKKILIIHTGLMFFAFVYVLAAIILK